MINPKKLFRSFTHAFRGLQYALAHDQNLRFHVYIALFVVAASVFFDVNPFEMGILGVMIILVIVAEMLNTSIEKMVDLITKEHRMEAKIAKDVSSGMVLVTAIGSIIIGILIFTPYLLRLIHWSS